MVSHHIPCLKFFCLYSMPLDSTDIERYIQIGSRDQHWYADCKKIFLKLFGEEKLPLVCKLFAATSINTSLKSNITLFRKALYEIENNLPVGKYLPNIRKQLIAIREGGELSGQKIRAFEKAMAGCPDAVVVDTWLLRAFKMETQYFRQKKGAEKGRGLLRSNGASEKTFTEIESWVRNYAAQKGYKAAEISSMIWAGIRIEKTGDRNTHYKEILENKLTNLFNVI